jgi:hypothetical protein
MGNQIYFKIAGKEGKFKLQKCSACQDLQKNFPQLKMCDSCEELFLLKCIFFVDSLLLVTQIIKGKQRKILTCCKFYSFWNIRRKVLFFFYKFDARTPRWVIRFTQLWRVIPLEMHFFCRLTAFGYSNNQREATLLQNVK